MCGIVGIVALHGARAPGEALSGAMVALAHRGPDDEGWLAWDTTRGLMLGGGPATPTAVWESDLPWRPERRGTPPDATVLLGHRRLAILDLAASGHQPMGGTPLAGEWWVAYNGEIYNYRELRAELVAHGERFRGHSDTEVLLAAWRRWGLAALPRLRGMWAALLFSPTRGELWALRDRVGIKPLFYHWDGRYLVLASEAKGLFATGLVPAEPDWSELYHGFSLGCAPRPRTAFVGVDALPAGGWLRLELATGRLTQGRWWRWALRDPERRSPEAWRAGIEARLRTAVAARLVADVPVAVFMSGGIDSTTTAALAASERPGIAAFTLAFGAEGRALDERAVAAATAARYGMDHHVEVVDPERLLGLVDEMVAGYEEPYPALAPNYLLAERVAAAGFRVVLSGLGGDELFAGYGRERWLRLWRRLRRLGRAAPLLVDGRPGSRRARLRGLAAARTLAEYFAWHLGPFTEPEKRRLFGPRAPEETTGAVLAQRYAHPELDRLDTLGRISWWDLCAYIGNHHVERTDRFTMRFSLESRFPLLDHELVDLALRLPGTWKVRAGEGKWILRRVAERWIARPSLEQPKRGFSLPMAAWLRGPLRSLATTALDRLRERNVLVGPELDRYRWALAAGRGDPEQLWHLVSLELWLERFVDG